MNQDMRTTHFLAGCRRGAWLLALVGNRAALGQVQGRLPAIRAVLVAMEARGMALGRQVLVEVPYEFVQRIVPVLRCRRLYWVG